jgi:hypothetical protein
MLYNVSFKLQAILEDKLGCPLLHIPGGQDMEIGLLNPHLDGNQIGLVMKLTVAPGAV